MLNRMGHFVIRIALTVRAPSKIFSHSRRAVFLDIALTGSLRDSLPKVTSTSNIGSSSHDPSDAFWRFVSEDWIDSSSRRFAGLSFLALFVVCFIASLRGVAAVSVLVLPSFRPPSELCNQRRTASSFCLVLSCKFR